MNVLDMVKDAFKYPLKNQKGFLLILIVNFIYVFLSKYVNFSENTLSISITIISFLIYIILLGITISIIKTTLTKSTEISKIDIKTIFLDGIKNLIVSIVYKLIPLIITAVIAIPIGFYSKLFTIINMTSNIQDPTSTEIFLQAIPESLRLTFKIDTIFLIVLFFILVIIMSIFLLIAQVRLAETGSLMESFKINKIFHKISSIGWKNYIMFVIMMGIIIMILSLIVRMIASVSLFIEPVLLSILGSFLILFIYHGVGLIYLEEKN